MAGLDGTALAGPRSGNVQAGDASCDHQALDLRRAFEDRVAHLARYDPRASPSSTHYLVARSVEYDQYRRVVGMKVGMARRPRLPSWLPEWLVGSKNGNNSLRAFDGEHLTMGRRLGRLKEILGLATGDRGAQARGRVEERAADPTDPLSRVSDEEVAREERRVREELGDVRPGGDDE